MPSEFDPQTVCHLSTVHAGFDARIWERECVTLANAGYSVHLYVPNEREQYYKGVHVHALRSFDRRIARFLYGRTAVGQAMRARPDLIHFHDPELIPVMLHLKSQAKVRIVFDCHEDTVGHILLKEHIPRPLKPLLRRATEYYFKQAARHFDAIVTADDAVTVGFQRLRARTVTLLNFPPRRIYTQSPDWNFDRRPYDVIYPGSTPRYHLDIMFRVAEMLKTQGRTTRWLIMAKFRFPDAARWIDRNLAERGLADCFDFLQPVPLAELPRFLHLARIGIVPLPNVPKFQRNIPSKIFDYCLAGLPVILSDLPPSRPFLQDRDIAICVPPDDIGAFAAAIAALLDEPLRLVKMGQRARDVGLRYFTWESQAEKLLQLYQEILHVDSTVVATPQA